MITFFVISMYVALFYNLVALLWLSDD